MSESKHAPVAWLVATGATHEGRETYTRHEQQPALCDAEPIYAPDLAAEVERLRAEAADNEATLRAAYENACAHRAAVVQEVEALRDDLRNVHKVALGRLTLLNAERRKAEALEAELALRRKSGSAVDRLHNLCEGIAADVDGSEWSREEWERIDAENAELRRKVEALREPTDAMVDAYLKANDAYWAEVDRLPSAPGVWRNGTPREATMVSLRAALAVSEQKG